MKTGKSSVWVLSSVGLKNDIMSGSKTKYFYAKATIIKDSDMKLYTIPIQN